MPVKFTVTPRKDPRDQNSTPKYYATVRSNGRADKDTIAKSINSMSTVSSVDTAAVLEAFLSVVPSDDFLIHLHGFQNHLRRFLKSF